MPEQAEYSYAYLFLPKTLGRLHWSDLADADREIYGVFTGDERATTHIVLLQSAPDGSCFVVYIDAFCDVVADDWCATKRDAVELVAEKYGMAPGSFEFTEVPTVDSAVALYRRLYPRKTSSG